MHACMYVCMYIWNTVPAGEDGAADAKRRHVQGMGRVARECYGASTAEESGGEDVDADAKAADPCAAVEEL
jgi:hypothetical protein